MLTRAIDRNVKSLELRNRVFICSKTSIIQFDLVRGKCNSFKAARIAC